MTYGSEEWCWFAVAEAIGGHSVAQLQAVLSPAELSRWIRYFSISPPLREVVADGAAIIGYTVHSHLRGKGSSPLPFENFRPVYRPSPPRSEEEIDAEVQVAFALTASILATIPEAPEHGQER